MIARDAAIDEYLAQHPLPRQVCAAPQAALALSRLLSGRPPEGARLIPLHASAPWPIINGPAVLILVPGDIAGPHRPALLQLARSLLPGRPVLIGGTDSRDLLIDAINVWRVVRILDAEVSPDFLVDALDKAHEVARLDRALTHAADELDAETKRLAAALTALEDAQRRLLHGERLATLGRITSGLIPVMAGHLARLQTFNDLVSQRSSARDPRVEELLSLAVVGIRSIQAMLDETHSYAESRPEIYRVELQQLDAAVTFATSLSRFDPLSRDRVILSDIASNALVRADPYRLYQVFINLVRNALQAAPPRGRVLISAYRDGDHAVIDVENDGDPIPDEIQARIFDPFFTTKGENGLGLGLSACRATLERHGGTIACVPRRRAPGACFRVRLPVAPGP